MADIVQILVFVVVGSCIVLFASAIGYFVGTLLGSTLLVDAIGRFCFEVS